MKYNGFIWSLLLIINSLQASVNENYTDAFGYYYNGEYNKAEISFSEALDGYKDEKGKLLFFRGLTRLKLDKYKSAEEDLLLALNSGEKKGALYLAKLYSKTGQIDEAFSYLKNYLTENPRQNTDELKQDTDLLKLSADTRWFDLWQNNWEVQEIDVIRGSRYYSGSGQYEQAVEMLNRHLIYSENKALLYVEIGNVYSQSGEYKLSAVNYYSALEMEPDNIEYKVSYCNALSKSHEYKKVLETGSEILSRSPEYFEIYLLRADANLNLDNPDQAEKDIGLYLRYFPGKEEAQFLFARILVESGKTTEALKVYNQLLAKKQSAALYKNRGILFFTTGTYKYAFADLSMSLDLDPTDGEVYYYYGLSLFYLSENQRACHALNKAYRYGEIRALEYLQKNCEQNP